MSITIKRPTALPSISIAAGVWILAAAPALWAQPVTESSLASKKAVSVEVAEGLQRQGFSVVLLLGDMHGAHGQDTVPAAARRALADMTDFLPYKAYRLLDTQWTLCCSSASPAVTRLRGLEDQEYELELRSFVEAANRMSVRFLLREVNDFQPGTGGKSEVDRTKEAADKSAGAALDRQLAEVNREIFGLERERLDLTAEAAKLKRQYEVGARDGSDLKRVEMQLAAVTQRMQALRQQVGTASTSPKFATRPVIDTSFRMDVGETVVVGTSGLKGGNKALIALLTAVPAKNKAR